MSTAKIVEIFKSIQGEGKYAGAEQIFVRFYKCNMHCSWCDTPHSIGDKNQSHKTLELSELQNEIEKLLPAHSISLTGGEPLVQADILAELIKLPANQGRSFHLETNGTLPAELKKVIDLVDVVAMDIKVPSSTNDRAYWDEHLEFLKIARQKDCFVKLVVSLGTTEDDISKAINLVAQVDKNILFILQPNSYELKQGVVELCTKYAALASGSLTQVRVLPQMHKFLKIR